jgi:DNA-binding response OmpR family regulator
MRPARIAIAEDEESIVTSLEFLMRRCGFETRVARDGRVALELLESYRPDVLILDVMLPHVSGLEVCRTVRARREWRGIGVLMLTARSGAKEEALGLAAGADAYLTKPFSTHELVERVKALAERSFGAQSPA